MIAKSAKANTINQKKPETGALTGTMTSQTRLSMTKSMHDGVEVWCDCCSCEAEPYWVEAMEEYPDSKS